MSPRLRGLTTIAVMALMIFLLAVGCGKGRRYEGLSADAAWAKIVKYFNKGRYLDTVEHLEVFLINHAGSAMADSAQYLLAESHFLMKEYIISASEFEKLYGQYPQSPLAITGGYKTGLSYYKLSPRWNLDQNFTLKAIDAFQNFIEDFPESDQGEAATKMIEVCRDKLARKEYEGGRLYHKMKEPASARIYYDSVLNNYYDTRYAPLAQYYKAGSYELSKDWQSAMEGYSIFLEKFDDHEWAVKALRNLNKARDKAVAAREEGRAQAKSGNG